MSDQGSVERPQIERVPYTFADFQQLVDVNFAVNQGTRYETDLAQYGVPEFWAPISAKGFGDCEDYCLTKMARLRALGWPQASLDIAVCYDAAGAGHAVLIAHLDRGDWVLDNNRDDPMPWKTAPYKWLEVSVGGSFETWDKIEA